MKPYRRLSEQFMRDLKDGRLKPILDLVKSEHKLALFIRHNYINVYYKGASLLRLYSNSSDYIPKIHKEYTKHIANMVMPKKITTREDADSLVKILRQAITGIDNYATKNREEIAFEQTFIGGRMTGPLDGLIILDRQYTQRGWSENRLDVLAIRRWKDTEMFVPVLIEVKHGDTGGVSQVASQARQYVDHLKEEKIWKQLIADIQSSVSQRRELGLLDPPPNTAECENLKIVTDPAFLEILILIGNHTVDIDYTLLHKDLPATHRITEVRLDGSGNLPRTKTIRDVGGQPTTTEPLLFSLAPQSSLLKPKSIMARKLYDHLIKWKDQHITREPGVKHGQLSKIVIPASHLTGMGHIHPSIRSRVAELGFKRHVNFDHMASSQIACLNLFLPILESQHAATVLAAIKSDIFEIDRSSLYKGFRIEYWGNDVNGDFRGLLGDKNSKTGTDCDIAIAYKTKTGERRLWLIEHKLTEHEFTTCGGKKAVDKIKKEGSKDSNEYNCHASFDEIVENPNLCYYHKPKKYKYWDITTKHKNFFSKASGCKTCPFADGRNQLWRNQLLGLAIKAADKGYAEVHFSVVKHPDNSSLNKTIQAYEELLSSGEMFSVFNSSEILKAALETKYDALKSWAEWYSDLYMIPLK